MAGATAALTVAVLSACGSEGNVVEIGASLQAKVAVGAPVDSQAYRPDTQG